MDIESYSMLLERVARLEERMDTAYEQREEIKSDLLDLKSLMLELKSEREKEKARIGGILWAASLMVAAVSTLAKIAWDWLKHLSAPGGGVP